MSPVLATCLTLLVVSSLRVTPVRAHFILGNLTPRSRFHSNAFDPHVAGPTAYIWHGGDLPSFTGFGDGFPSRYQSPYPSAEE